MPLGASPPDWREVLAGDLTGSWGRLTRTRRSATSLPTRAWRRPRRKPYYWSGSWPRVLRTEDPRLAKVVRALDEHPEDRFEPRRVQRADPAWCPAHREGALTATVRHPGLRGPSRRGHRTASTRRTRTDDRAGAVGAYHSPARAGGPRPVRGRASAPIDGQSHCDRRGGRPLLHAVLSCKPDQRTAWPSRRAARRASTSTWGASPAASPSTSWPSILEGRPHNPMVNAGAIMIHFADPAGVTSTSPIASSTSLDAWTSAQRREPEARASATRCTCLEPATADRNFALGYSMREQGAFPEGHRPAGDARVLLSVLLARGRRSSKFDGRRRRDPGQRRHLSRSPASACSSQARCRSASR